MKTSIRKRLEAIADDNTDWIKMKPFIRDDSIEDEDAEAMTPLLLAVSLSRVAFVQFLMRIGADPFHVGSLQKSAFALAKQIGNKLVRRVSCWV